MSLLFRSLFTALLLCSPALAADSEASAPKEKAEFDAKDPTNTASAVGVGIEWGRNVSAGGTSNTYGLRVEAKLGFSKSAFILLEMPFQYADNSRITPDTPSAFAPADMRLRLLGLPYMGTGTVMAAGFSFDLVTPSGPTEVLIGTGRWTIVPGAIVGFKFTKWFLMFPIVSYALSAPMLKDGSGLTHGIQVLPVTVFILPKGFFISLEPTLDLVLSGNGNTGFNLRTNVGIQVKKHALFARYKREFIRDRGIIDIVSFAWKMGF